MSASALLALLPTLVFLLLWRHCRGSRGGPATALVLFGVAVVTITEGLAVGGALSRRGLAGAWLVLAAALLAAGLRRQGRRFLFLRPLGSPPPAAAPATASAPDAPRTPIEWILLGGAVFLFVATGLLALFTPPQHGDVLSYQLPRIVQWLRQGDLAFWGTEDLRQLTYSPGLEYLVLTFHALSGGDRLDVFVPWLGFLGCGLLVMRMVRQEAGGRRIGGAAALLFWAAQPQGLWQSTNGKAEMWVALWCLAALDRLLEFRRQPRPGILLAAAAAMGLAGLTKSTGWFLALGLLATQPLGWRRAHWRPALRALGPAALVILLLNLGHAARNWRAFGSPWGPDLAASPLALATDSLAPRDVAVNVAKHLSNHLRQPSQALARATQAAVERFAAALGVDPNRPGSNFIFHSYVLRPPHGSESDATSWPQFLLLWIFLPITLGGMLVAARRDPVRAPPLLTAALVLGGTLIGWIVFAGMVRWQSGSDRFQILFLAPGAVAWGLAVGGPQRRPIPPRPRLRFGLAVSLALLLVAAPYSIDAPGRSLRPDRSKFLFAPSPSRAARMYGSQPALLGAIEAAADWARSVPCPAGRDPGTPLIGIASELDRRDYLIFAALDATQGEPVAAYFDFRTDRWPRATPPPSPAGEPCAVLCMGCTPQRIRGLERFADAGRLRVITDFERNIVPHGDLSAFGR